MNRETIIKAEEKLQQLKQNKRQIDYDYAMNKIQDTTRSKQLKEDIRVAKIKLEGYKRIYKGENEDQVTKEIKQQIGGE